jgi:hypothetical protein
MRSLPPPANFKALPFNGEYLDGPLRSALTALARFMMGDAFWVLAMGISVLLIFSRKTDRYDGGTQKLEKWYALLCYGLPSIPAVIYLILDHVLSTPIIGSATVSTPISC